ncbi:MAG: hypothetical protein WC477_00275 [Patescibacteria group bacterium]
MKFGKRTNETIDTLTKKLGFDVRFYGKSFSFYSISYATTVLRGIASTYLVTLWVAPEILGQFRYVLAIYALAGMFSFGGYGTSMIKGLARGESDIVKKSIKKIFLYAPLGSLILILSAIDRFTHQEQNVGIAMLVAAIAFVPYSACAFYNQIYIGLEKIKKLTVVSVWSDVLYAILFTLVLLKTHNLAIITLAYFLIDIVIQGWFTWRAYRSIPSTSTRAINDSAMPLGKHLNWIYVIQGITGSLGLILLQRFWGYTTLAAFSVAMLLPEQCISLAKTMSGTILQRLSRHDAGGTKVKNIQKQFWHALIASIAIILAYAAVAPFILPILFPKYPDAVLPSIAYSLGILALPSIIGINYFLSIKNIKKYWLFSNVTSFLQFVTSVVLIPWFGNWGAIWSRVTTRLGALPFSYPVEEKK